jgi:ribose-phosphate pyrophosphokinase
VDHLYAAPVIVRDLQAREFVNPVVVSPDVGGLKMASSYAENIGAGLAIVAKRRKSATETEALNVIGEVEGRDVIIVDDLTETGGTLVSASRALKERGARQVIACVSHAVISDLGAERLQKSGISELITTNSVPVRAVPDFKITTLCISELLGEGIKRIHDDESVSSLFEISKKEKV